MWSCDRRRSVLLIKVKLVNRGQRSKRTQGCLENSNLTDRKLLFNPRKWLDRVLRSERDGSVSTRVCVYVCVAVFACLCVWQA